MSAGAPNGDQKVVLLVEDDPSLAMGLCDALEFEGFRVVHTELGSEAIEQARKHSPDCILLDLMLPDLNGYQVCEQIRRTDLRTPILMLTARGQEADKVRGFELGADDYVTKPFHIEELLARIQAVLRRARPAVHRLTLGDVVVDLTAMRATAGGREFHLTHREFEVLRYLAEREPNVVSRSELLREVWGYLDSPTTRSVDHAVARIRKKIEADPHRPKFLHTVHGDGYCLTSNGAAEASE
jgi:DNA-binding response OmpR family regulator